jgi:hypothetical protein
MHSGIVKLGENRRTALGWSYRSVDVIINCLLKDDLKYATNFPSTPVKSAFFTQASTNVYMGANISNDANNNGEEETLLRTAYGVGSGATSIGLNPATTRNNPIPGPLWELVQIHTKAASDANPEWAAKLQAYPINNVAGKFYYGYLDENGKWQLKYTGGHNDVLQSKRNNVPFRNNSQEPDSLVLMYLFGDPKELWFKKHYDKTGQTKLQNPHRTNAQKHGCSRSP